MFKVGDKISHPVHGAGIIQDIEEKEILGEEKSFYTISIPSTNMKLMVATETAESVGIRKVIKKEEMKIVMDKLELPDEDRKVNWMERSRNNVEKIKSGKIEEVAAVVKELYKLDNKKGLSSTEKRMYTNARHILLSELSIVNNVNNEQADALISEALNKSIEIM